MHPQLFDYAKTDSASAMNSHAAGLIDSQQSVIFMQDGESIYFAGIDNSLRCRTLVRQVANRRDAQEIAKLQAVFGGDPFSVDADLTASEQLIDMTLRDIFQPLEQKIINPLVIA